VYLFALGNGWLEELRGSKFPGIQILPTYSIIVPYRNEIGNIEQCLRRLMDQQTGYQFEIIAVDDNSEDGSRNIVDKLKKVCIYRMLPAKKQPYITVLKNLSEKL
jgi:cellulose synthase/poly-beta-1,6-N-acetylglucosamine synthase-like glycosyltransferase